MAFRWVSETGAHTPLGYQDLVCAVCEDLKTEDNENQLLCSLRHFPLQRQCGFIVVGNANVTDTVGDVPGTQVPERSQPSSGQDWTLCQTI